MSSPYTPRGLIVAGASVSALVGVGCGSAPTVDMCDELADAPESPPAEVDGGLIYEIYLRSFQDSDGDGIGDLQGLMWRLPYLQALGVETLWLMPVFPSPGPTGYDVESFEVVRADYGSTRQLAALVQQAEGLGMRVMLDVPINHTAVTHPWFIAAAEDPSSPLRDRYLFSDHQWDDLRWHDGPAGDWYYYGYFGEGFPDLDWSQPPLPQALAAAMQDWLDLGIGGFRLDAVRQLVEADGDISDTVLGHCALAWLDATLSQDQDPLLLGEAWAWEVETVLPYLGSDARPQSDLVSAVPRVHAIGQAFLAADRADLVALLQAEQAAGAEHRMATYVSSHDIPRFRTRIKKDEVRRSWLVLLFTLPGSPVLYYGDELDLRDSARSSGQDYAWRAPMAWTADPWGGFTTGTPWMAPTQDYIDGTNVFDQDQDPDSTLSLVRALSLLRQDSDALRSGELELLDVGDPAVLAFTRTVADQAVLVVLNLGEEELRPALPGAGGPSWFDLVDGAPALDVEVEGVALAPLGYRVLATEELADQRVPGPLPTTPPAGER